MCLEHKMHLNDLCTGNQFDLIQQTYSSQTTDAPQQQTIFSRPHGGLQTTATTINHQGHQPLHSADESSQLNSSLSSSSGVGCTSTNSSGLGTSSVFSSGSLSSTTTNNHNNQASTMNCSNNGSFVNVLLPLADMNNHNLHRAQLISNLSGSTNQYTTLALGNYTTSNTSSPSSVNTNATNSTLPIGEQQFNNLSHNNKMYTQNGQLLNDALYHCQQTSFNTNSAIIDNNLPTHYQLLPHKHLNHHHQNSNYLLQTVPPNQNNTANYSTNNLHSSSINNYLNHDDLNKYSSVQFDLVCDNRMSPVYTKLSPNSNSMVKECLITNAENTLMRNSSKYIELTSSQNSSSTVYSDILKSKLATSSKDNLKLIQAVNTGLDLLNCDKNYNEIVKSNDLKNRTESLNKLDKCKGKCSKDKCNCVSKSDNSKNSSKNSGKKDAAAKTCQRQLSTKVSKSSDWCCLSSDNPKKQGICFIILATCILVLLLCFFFYSLNSPATRNLLVESGLLPESIRLRLFNETANRNRFQPDSSLSSSNFFTPQRAFYNETIFPLNGPRPSLDYSDSLLQQQQQQQQQQSSSPDNNSHYFYQSSFSSSSPLARTYSSNQNPQTIGMQDNNIPQIYAGSNKDEQTGDMFGNLNSKLNEEKNIPKNVTAQSGHLVYLHCIVEPIGDKMVSWIRLKDFYLLTVGTFTYTSDSRFSVKQLSNNDWTLQILRLTTHDQGIYECQLNTDPPRSQFYNLIVLVPYAIIQNNVDEIEVRPGDSIELTCIINRSPIPPSFVFWYHEQRMINFDLNNAKARGKINLFKRNELDDTVVSKLTIFNAILGDSGNYTCAPSNSAPTSIYVQVLQGERRLSDDQDDNNLNSFTNRQIRTQGGNSFASNAQNQFIFQLIMICLLFRLLVHIRL